MKIIILGAGVIGVTTAYYLNKLGHDVTVIERNEKCASECSFANGGQLSYSHAEPWATPASLRKIPKWLLDKNSPLVFHPSLDPFMWKWALKFLGRCTNKHKEEATIHTLRLALHSKNCLAELLSDTLLDFSYLEKGTLHTFRNAESLNANIAQAEFQKKLGCEYQILHSRADCEKIEPALQYAPAEIIGGIYFPMDATGNVHQFSTNLTLFLQSKGVQFIYGQKIQKILLENDKVTDIITDNGKYSADAFVMSLGASSRLLLKDININVPIYPMKGYSISIDIKNHSKTPVIGITDQHNKIVYSKLGNILRVAGTAEFNGYNDSVSKTRIDTMKKMVGELFPESGDIDTVTQWACLRPSTPEGTPIIGKTKYPNLYLNTGHGTLGWTLACGSASIVANIISGLDPQIDLTGLSLAKY